MRKIRPSEGDSRTVHRFLLLPKTLDCPRKKGAPWRTPRTRETRWLERAAIHQRVTEWGWWEDISWAD